jgi:pimeloyl-ACP methyl ester carboxylesterase
MVVKILIAAAIFLFLFKMVAGTSAKSLPFRYKTYGDTNKPTIFIIPGLDGTPSFFVDIVPELTVEYHVIVYYLPQISPVIKVGDYTFEYIVKDILSVVDELNVKEFSIIGEAFGGIVAQLIASEHANRVKCLILVSSLAYTNLPPEVKRKAQRTLPILSFISSIAPKLAQAMFMKVHVNDVIATNEPSFVKDYYLKEGNHAHFPSVLARIKIAFNMDIREKTKSITKPTLILSGADDHYTGKDSVLLKQLIPKSELRTLPGGHLFHIGQSKEFSKLTKGFVKSVHSNSIFPW